MAMVQSPTLRSRAAQVLAAGALMYTGVLVFLTHYPRPQELLGEDLPPDKMLHFLAYGVLGFLVTAAVVTRRRWSWRTAGLTAVALAGFAALDELTQPLFGRSAEPMDWIWDLAGLAAGIVALAAGRRLLKSPVGRRLRSTHQPAQ